MIFGDKKTFAIECENVSPPDMESYIHFRVWARGHFIGDYEETVLLKASLSWLLEFMKYSQSRREPSLDTKSKEEVFQLIFDSVVLTVPQGLILSDVVKDSAICPDPTPPSYANVRERFHLDQIGMSSFSDKWNIILIENEDRSQRLMWRNLKDMQVHEALLPPSCFENAVSGFIQWANLLV